MNQWIKNILWHFQNLSHPPEDPKPILYYYPTTLQIRTHDHPLLYSENSTSISLIQVEYWLEEWEVLATRVKTISNVKEKGKVSRNGPSCQVLAFFSWTDKWHSPDFYQSSALIKWKPTSRFQQSISCFSLCLSHFQIVLRSQGLLAAVL